MPSPWSPSVQRILGVVLIALGVAIWIAWRMLDLGALGGALCAALGAIVAIGGQQIYNRGRRQQVAMEVQPPSPDAHNIVTYLRSFPEDRTTSGGISTGIAFGGAAVITEEEQLVEALSAVGPVIAVGEPGENLPPLGATRLYFDHAEWQRGVEDLLRRSALVVLRPGPLSPGVQWEIRKSLELVPPQRLLMVVTGRAGRHRNRDLAVFADQLNPLIPHPIPSTYPTKGLYHLGTIRAFIRFDTEWRPSLLPLEIHAVPLVKRSVKKRLVPYFRETLRPVLSAIGYPPATTKASAGQIAALGCLGLMGVVILFGLAATLFS